MKTDRDLKDRLARIDGSSYKAYKDLEGTYRFSDYDLDIDHVQGDPYAAPSLIRVVVARKASGLLDDTTANRSRSVALADFLTRQFYASCRQFSRGGRGIGKSGLITIDKPVQEILARSAMVIDRDKVEARFFMGLPAYGRKIAGKDARAMFFEELPRIVASSLFARNLDRRLLYRHLETSEDADVLRNSLKPKGLIGFVADGACLPRFSGVDPRPLDPDHAVAFRSPPRFSASVHLPNQGKLRGMGLPTGVTLIVGGGYHGKSTLLKALELGIYNHLPGDGREGVVTVPGTVKIRAADGRNIVNTDISPFINNLPFNQDTAGFSTPNASGSTSQAANISEALEAGADVLLLDEDTSATNFMIRDFRMQQLVSKDKEPITPFIDKVKQLYTDKGVSTVVVMGGSGDYFAVADHVIQMTGFLPSDVTDRAHRIAETASNGRVAEGGSHFEKMRKRIPLQESFDPTRGRRIKISAPRLHEIVFGRSVIDLGDMEQLVDMSQTRAIGHAIGYATRYMDGRRTLKEVIECVMDDIGHQGLDILTPYCSADLARFRDIELAGAVNRMRTLRIIQKA